MLILDVDLGRVEDQLFQLVGRIKERLLLFVDGIVFQHAGVERVTHIDVNMSVRVPWCLYLREVSSQLLLLTQSGDDLAWAALHRLTQLLQLFSQLFFVHTYTR